MKRRLPRLWALVLWVFVRGAGSEHVRGDIVERWADDLARGVSPGEARRRLRRQVVGSVLSWWKPTAILRRMGPIADLRLAARGLSRRPAFTASAALTLGLGIGATTTIYSVVDGVLLRPLPFPDSEALVMVGTTFPGREWSTTSPDLQHLAGTSVLNYLDFDARATSFEELAAVETTSVLLPDEGNGPELATAARISDDFLDVLRTSPSLGRNFTSDEYEASGSQVALISHGTWMRRFGGDPGVVGNTVAGVGGGLTVVGVLPEDFEPPEAMFGRPPEFWLPLQTGDVRYKDRGRRSLVLLGRLQRGITVAQARDEMHRIADQVAADHPEGNVYPDGTHFGAGVNGLRDQTVGGTRRALILFLGASALLLLLSALNAATMLLTRTLDRARELGVRRALGASRARVFADLLSESVLLSLAGGGAGVALAFGGVALFVRFAPTSMPRAADVSVDAGVLVVASLVSVGAGILAGLIPAARYARTLPASGLRAGASRSVAASDNRLRSVMVAGQMALAVVLVAGAGLLMNSLVRLRTVDPGFRAPGLVTLRMGIKRPGADLTEPTWREWDRLLGEVAPVPGVMSWAGASNVPFQDPNWAPRILFPGEPETTERSGIAGYVITPSYLSTVGTSLLAGRDIRASDGPDDPRVALVNQAFVAQELGGRDPLGQTLRNVDGDTETEWRIVGVVDNAVQTRTEDGMRPAVYIPYTQADWPIVEVVVRSDLPAEVLIPELRKAVARFSPYVPALDVRTMQARMAATRATPRFQTLLLTAFALLALLLAAAGLYGSMAHAVARRKRELGIRTALGAEPAGLLALVLGRGMRLTAAGMTMGLLGALALTRLLRGFLFGVEPGDPATLGLAAAVLALTALAASVLPALRAARVDPIEVLRAE